MGFLSGGSGLGGPDGINRPRLARMALKRNAQGPIMRQPRPGAHAWTPLAGGEGLTPYRQPAKADARTYNIAVW